MFEREKEKNNVTRGPFKSHKLKLCGIMRLFKCVNLPELFVLTVHYIYSK